MDNISDCVGGSVNRGTPHEASKPSGETLSDLLGWTGRSSEENSLRASFDDAGYRQLEADEFLDVDQRDRKANKKGNEPWSVPLSAGSGEQEPSYCRCRVAVKMEDGRAKAFSLPCNSWTCPKCAPRRRKRLIAQAISGEPNTFITLTVNPNLYSEPEEAARDLVQSWDILKKRMEREARRPIKVGLLPFGNIPTKGYKTNDQGGYDHRVIIGERKLQYVWVMEKTAKGWPHLHILCRSRWISHDWLSAQMADLIGAPIVDIRRLNSARASVKYAAKYCGKDTAKFEWTKRYSFSRLFRRDEEYKRKRAEAKSSTWFIYPMRLNTLLNRWIQLGATLFAVEEYCAEAYLPEQIVPKQEPL